MVDCWPYEWCQKHPRNKLQIAVKQTDTKDVGKHYFQTKTRVEENVRDMLTRLYNQELIEAGPTERKTKASMSQKDQEFVKILEGTKLRNGHYQLPLPFKGPSVNLPKTDARKGKDGQKINNSRRPTSGL